MEKIRTCPICGREFVTGRRRYCSESCSREARIEYQKKANREMSRKPRPVSAVPRGKPKRESSLQEIARKAREAGMTYGQYVALEYAKIRRG
ncbi:MAG: hypothetical protein HFG99_11475 [Dorea sp.]|jgi:hypothetical protein|nr:hypothetical protein [Dorea sp.]